MATNPDQLQQEAEQRHQREAEATALALLLLRRKRYDLPALIASRGIKARPFRRISPSGVMALDFAQPYLRVVRAWSAEQAGLIAAYEQARATGDRSGLVRALEAAGAAVAVQSGIARREVPSQVDRIERWHRIQWLSRVKASTKLDVSVFTAGQDVAPEIDSAVAWNEQLIDDVDAQTKARIAAALLGGIAVAAPATRTEAVQRAREARRQSRQGEGGSASGAPPTGNQGQAGGQEGEPTSEPQQSVDEQITDAIDKARGRAKNIGVDQAEKTSAAMTRGRRQSAGVGSWRWRHYDPQPHPRIEHIRRDGKVYSDTRPPPTQPGEEPFCKCWEETVL